MIEGAVVVGLVAIVIALMLVLVAHWVKHRIDEHFVIEHIKREIYARCGPCWEGDDLEELARLLRDWEAQGQNSDRLFTILAEAAREAARD